MKTRVLATVLMAAVAIACSDGDDRPSGDGSQLSGTIGDAGASGSVTAAGAGGSTTGAGGSNDGTPNTNAKGGAPVAPDCASPALFGAPACIDSHQPCATASDCAGPADGFCVAGLGGGGYAAVNEQAADGCVDGFCRYPLEGSACSGDIPCTEKISGVVVCNQECQGNCTAPPSCAHWLDGSGSAPFLGLGPIVDGLVGVCACDADSDVVSACDPKGRLVTITCDATATGTIGVHACPTDQPCVTDAEGSGCGKAPPVPDCDGAPPGSSECIDSHQPCATAADCAPPPDGACLEPKVGLYESANRQPADACVDGLCHYPIVDARCALQEPCGKLIDGTATCGGCEECAPGYVQCADWLSGATIDSFDTCICDGVKTPITACDPKGRLVTIACETDGKIDVEPCASGEACVSADGSASCLNAGGAGGAPSP